MVAKPIELGGKYFNTRTELEEYLRAILRIRKDKALEGEEFSVVHDLLLLHQDAEDKIGSGVKEIKVVLPPRRKYNCFCVVRTDGTTETFSYPKCTYSRERLTEKRRSSAYREAIHEQTGNYRFVERKTEQFCDICGSDQDLQVDHRKPFFTTLVKDFEKGRTDIPTEFDDAIAGTQYSKKFRESDRAYKEAWQAYHQENARLRLLCKTHNLAQKRKEPS